MPKKASRWVHLVTAPDQLTAEMWQELLQSEGVPAMITPEDAVSFLGPSPRPCRLLVPRGMLKEAKAILAEHLEAPGL